MYEDSKTIEIQDADLLVIKQEEDSALAYRERKHDDWLDNYTLYRDKVITNRLTQRQTINIPLMKYVLNTQLKEMMDAPQLYFNNLNNDQQKELYFNEYWKETARLNKLTIRDHVDKKQNGIFGRSFKKLNIENGKVTVSLVDPQDMLVHRFVDPTDIDSAPSIIQTGIYMPLREIMDNEDFDSESRKQLKLYFSEESGRLEQEENFEKFSEKSDRLRNLGVEDADDPVLGETYVELHEVYRFEYSELKKDTVIFRYVVASTGGGMFKLHKIELCELLGKTSDNFWYNHFPYTSWAGDPEATDFWSDGVADIIRPINKVLNVWISQHVENRTLKNFNMKYYDSTNNKFVPQTFTPQPGGYYPTPGDPNKVIKEMNVGDIGADMESITFLMGIAEKASASTSANSGSVESRKVTLGEVEYALANAQKRILIQQVFYTEDWKDLGIKYAKLLEGAGDQLDDLMTVKKGRLGKKVYRRKIGFKNYKSANWYAVEVKTVTEQQDEQIDAVERMSMLRNEMPNNIPLRDIIRRKLMEINRFSPEEVSQIEEFEKQNTNSTNVVDVLAGQGGQPTMPQGIPEMPEIANKQMQ